MMQVVHTKLGILINLTRVPSWCKKGTGTQERIKPGVQFHTRAMAILVVDFQVSGQKLGRFFTKSLSFKWNNAEPTNIRPTFTKQTCQMTYLKIITSHNQNGFYFKIILWLKNCTICSGKSKFSYH